MIHFSHLQNILVDRHSWPITLDQVCPTSKHPGVAYFMGFTSRGTHPVAHTRVSHGSPRLLAPQSFLLLTATECIWIPSHCCIMESFDHPSLHSLPLALFPCCTVHLCRHCPVSLQPSLLYSLLHWVPQAHPQFPVLSWLLCQWQEAVVSRGKGSLETLAAVAAIAMGGSSRWAGALGILTLCGLHEAHRLPVGQPCFRLWMDRGGCIVMCMFSVCVMFLCLQVSTIGNVMISLHRGISQGLWEMPFCSLRLRFILWQVSSPFDSC